MFYYRDSRGKIKKSIRVSVFIDQFSTCKGKTRGSNYYIREKEGENCNFSRGKVKKSIIKKGVFHRRQNSGAPGISDALKINREYYILF